MTVTWGHHKDETDSLLGSQEVNAHDCGQIPGQPDSATNTLPEPNIIVREPRRKYEGCSYTNSGPRTGHSNAASSGFTMKGQEGNEGANDGAPNVVDGSFGEIRETSHLGNSFRQTGTVASTDDASAPLPVGSKTEYDQLCGEYETLSNQHQVLRDYCETLYKKYGDLLQTNESLHKRLGTAMTNNSTLTGTINSLQTGKDALERKLYDLSQKIEPLFKHLIDAETRNEITMTKAMEAEQVIDLLRRTLRTAAREAAKSRVYSMYPGLSQGGSRRQSTHVILGSNGYPARPLVAANA